MPPGDRHRIFKEQPHTADLCVEIYGKTRAEVFHHGILTLYNLLGLVREEDPCGDNPCGSGEETLAFSGMDEADLLVQLLGELLAVAVTERKRWVPREGSYRLTRDGETVSFRVDGAWCDLLPNETDGEREIKAVT